MRFFSFDYSFHIFLVLIQFREDWRQLMVEYADPHATRLEEEEEEEEFSYKL